jgi:hypothetical protein
VNRLDACDIRSTNSIQLSVNDSENTIRAKDERLDWFRSWLGRVGVEDGVGSVSNPISPGEEASSISWCLKAPRTKRWHAINNPALRIVRSIRGLERCEKSEPDAEED